MHARVGVRGSAWECVGVCGVCGCVCGCCVGVCVCASVGVYTPALHIGEGVCGRVWACVCTTFPSGGTRTAGHEGHSIVARR